MDLSPELAAKYVTLKSMRSSSDLAPAFREADLLYLFQHKDAPTTREELDAKTGPKQRYWHAIELLFNDPGFQPRALGEQDWSNPVAGLNPNAATLPQPLRKLKDRYGELRKEWDVAYQINYKKSGNMNPDFWDYCGGNLVLYYLYLAMTEKNSDTLFNLFPSELPDGVSYSASVVMCVRVHAVSVHPV